MGLFGKLFPGKLRPVLAAHPELGPAVQALQARMDVTPARAVFAAARGRWDVRWLALHAIADHYIARLSEASRAEMMSAWVESTPDDPLAWLARAVHRVEAAWQARGRGRADAVSSSARDAFAQHMRAAAPDLARAAALDPTDPTPHYLLMGAAPGLHAGDGAKAAVVAHHADVVARAPDHHLAHKRLVFLVSERWYGSHAESVATAHRLAAAAPDGSELPMLVVIAHEYARSHLHFFAGDAAGAATYARRGDVADDVATAYARSLGSPRHAATALTLYRRHEAALWFWATDDRARCAHELARVGDAFDENADPWHVSSERYRAIRRAVGL
jgi:hypothetical protein